MHRNCTSARCRSDLQWRHEYVARDGLFVSVRYQSDVAVDGTKVDVFALGSVVFSLVTKDKPFDRAIPSDPGWQKILIGEAGPHLAVRLFLLVANIPDLIWS